MESLRASDNPHNILSAITEWWHNWINRRAAIRDLNRCGEDEIALHAPRLKHARGPIRIESVVVDERQMR